MLIARLPGWIGDEQSKDERERRKPTGNENFRCGLLPSLLRRGVGGGGLRVCASRLPPPQPSPARAGLSRERTQVIQMTQVRSLESRVREISKDASAASTCYDSKKFSRDSPAARGGGSKKSLHRLAVLVDAHTGVAE